MPPYRDFCSQDPHNLRASRALIPYLDPRSLHVHLGPIFIWAQMNDSMRRGPDAAEVVFAEGEVGLVEDPFLSWMARAAQVISGIPSTSGVGRCVPFRPMAGAVRA